MSKIKAIIKRPDEEYGHVANISNTLENLQEIVGGHIETLYLGHGLILIVNEEGKLLGLEPNFRTARGFFADIIVGTARQRSTRTPPICACCRRPARRSMSAGTPDRNLWT